MVDQDKTQKPDFNRSANKETPSQGKTGVDTGIKPEKDVGDMPKSPRETNE